MLVNAPYFLYPSGGGSAAPTIIQKSTALAASASFSAATTAGNTILIIGIAPNCPSGTFTTNLAGSTNILNFYNATAYGVILAWYLPNAASIPAGTSLSYNSSQYFNQTGIAIFELSPVTAVAQKQTFLPVVASNPEIYNASCTAASSATLGFTIWAQSAGAYNNSVATLPSGWTMEVNSFNAASTYAYAGLGVANVSAGASPNAVWNITNTDTNNRQAQAATFLLA